MTNTEPTGLVLKDEAGNYYLLSQETLEQIRVPEERRAKLERLIAEAQDARPSEQDDAQGYAIPLLYLAACAVWSVNAAVIIGLTGPDVPSGPMPTTPRHRR